MKHLRKTLALLLTFAMVFPVTPGRVFAEEMYEDPVQDPGAVYAEEVLQSDAAVPVTYALSFYANAEPGTVSDYTMTVQEGQPVELPDNWYMAPACHVFAGWQIGENVYQPHDQIILAQSEAVIPRWEDDTAAHVWSVTGWNWAEDNTSAEVILTCTQCGGTQTAPAGVSTEELEDRTVYTAGITIGNAAYCDTRESYKETGKAEDQNTEQGSAEDNGETAGTEAPSGNKEETSLSPDLRSLNTLSLGSGNPEIQNPLNTAGDTPTADDGDGSGEEDLEEDDSETTVVARIGENEYYSYAEALGALQDGQTLVVLNLDEARPLILGGKEGPNGTFIIDLAGGTIMSTGLEVYEGADVTIQNGVLEDDATVYGGKLTVAADAVVGSAEVRNAGDAQTAPSTLVINGKVGTIDDEGTFTAGNVTVTYGTLEVNEGAAVGEIEIAAGSPAVNINGGTVESVSAAGDSPEITVADGAVNSITIGQGNGAAKLTITGGEIGGLSVSSDNADISISGGKFGSDVSEYLDDDHEETEEGQIVEKQLQVTIQPTSVVYNGSEQRPDITVKYGETVLTENTDYTLSWNDSEGNRVSELKEAGTYKATVNGTGRLEGKTAVSSDYVIKQVSGRSRVFRIEGEEKTFNGAPLETELRFFDEEDQELNLTEGTDYKAAYSRNIDAGEANVLINYIGNYKGTDMTTFTISQANLEDVSIDISSGKEKNPYVIGNPEPKVTVKLGSYKLPETEYSAEFRDLDKEGTGKVIITSKEANITAGTKEADVKVVDAAVKYTDANGKVTYSETITGFSTGTYQLLKDISRDKRLVPGFFASDIILDLNGHTLTSAAADNAILLGRNGKAESPKKFAIVDTSEGKGGKLAVNPAASAALMVSGKFNEVTIGAGVIIDGGCIALVSDNQKLDVNGTVNGGNDFAVAVNGSSTNNAVININSGAVLTSNTTAVYLPGRETTKATVSGSVTGGRTGIEIRAGELTVEPGATVKSTYSGEPSSVANGSGTTSTGAAIAIAQHSTKLPLKVVINGGTIEGPAAVYESNPQQNDEAAMSSVSAEVKGGVLRTTLENGSAIVTDDGKVTISGGVYSDNTDKTNEAVPEGKALVKITEGENTGMFELRDLVSVTFDSNGGSAVETAKIAKGTAVAEPEEPVKGHDVFEGWYLGEEEYDFETPVTEDIELKAQWKEATLKLSSGNKDVLVNDKETAAFGVKLNGKALTEEQLEAVKWSSDKTEIVKVDENTGVITPGANAGVATITAEYDGLTATATVTVKEPVAEVDGVGYLTLSAAISAAKGATEKKVILLQDQNLSGIFNRFTIKATDDITLDLGGKSLTMNGAYFTLNGGKLTVTNGAINASGNMSQEFTVNSGELTIDSTAVINGTGKVSPIGIFGPATVNTAGKLTAVNSFAVAGNGSGGKGGYTVNVTGGEISSENAPAIYHPNDGTVNISGGTVTGTTAVYQKSGTLNITGGTLHGSGAKNDYMYNGNGANSTGDALVIDNCGYPGGAPTTSVTGGVIISDNANAVGSYAYGNNEPESGFITGGIYSDNSEMTDIAVPEDKILAEIKDGTYAGKYELKDAVTVTFDANNETEPVKQKIVRETTVDEPEMPTRGHDVFNGWYLEDDAYDFSSAVNDSITLTAHWKAAELKLSTKNKDALINGKEVAVFGVKLNGKTLTEEQLAAVKWHSDNAEIAEVNESTGVITPGAKAGTATITAAYDGLTATGTVTVKEAVAEVDGVGYLTLSAAISAAKGAAEKKVILLQDQNLSGIFNRFTLKAADDITLDLGGKTLTMNGAYFTLNGGKLTVTNGTINASGNMSQEFTVNSGELTIDSTAVINGTGKVSPIGIFGPATVNTAGKLTAVNSFAVAGNGSGGKGGYTVNVTGGEISSENAPAIYHPNDGTVNISGGTVTGTTAVYQKSGTLNITGGTLHGSGAKNDYMYNGNGANSTGDALVIDNCGYPGGAPTTSVTGGVIISDNADPVGSYAYKDGNEPKAGFISGGEFSKVVPDEYCAEGYAPVEDLDGNNLYPVHKHAEHMSKVEAREATCTEEGNKEYWTCEICGKYFEDEAAQKEITDKNSVIIPALEHAYEYTILREATCTKAGVKTGTCSHDSSHTTVEVIPATGHELETVAAKDPTYEEDGVKAHYKCKNCGELFKDEEGKEPAEESDVVIPKLTMGLGTVSPITQPEKAEITGGGEETVSVNYNGLELSFSKADPNIGRMIDADWTGFNVVAPEEVTKEYLQSHEVSYSNDGGKTKKSFNRNNDGTIKTGEYAGRYRLECWVPLVAEEVEAKVAKGETEADWTYRFDWDGDGEYEQTLLVKIDLTNISLKGEDGEVAVRTEDGSIKVHSKLTHVEAADAKCTEEGNKEYWTCEICGKYFEDEAAQKEITDKNSVVIPALEHTYEYTVLREATCTEPGVEKGICTNDKTHTDVRLIAAAGHILKHVEAAGASCRSAGNTEYWTCENCGRYFSDQEGTSEITEKDWVIPAKAHTPGAPVKENEIAATCAKEGSYDEVVYCTECTQELSREKVSTPVSDTHNWNSWVVLVDATCSGKGVRYRVCKEKALHQEIEVIPATGKHDLLAVSKVPATCTAAGTEAYYKCSHCGKLFSDAAGRKEIASPVSVKPLGHSWSAPVWTWSSDHSIAMARFTCSVCGETKTDIATVKQTVTPAKPGVAGKTDYTASVTEKGRTYTDTKTAAIPALKNPDISYRTHVQTYGWQGYVKNGAMSGTEGKSKRLEGINIKLDNLPYSGSVVYRTHVQTFGWQGWKKDGEMSGTEGKAKRLEGIQIYLTGELAKHYDIYYRVHAQTYGWMDWAKNGVMAGTSGLSKRLEGINIVLVPKGGKAPGSMARSSVCGNGTTLPENPYREP